MGLLTIKGMSLTYILDKTSNMLINMKWSDLISASAHTQHTHGVHVLYFSIRLTITIISFSGLFTGIITL